MSLSFDPSTSPLFAKLGKIIHAAKTLETARETTVPTEIEDVLDQYATGSIDLQSIPDTLQDATSGWQSAGDSAMLSLQDVFRNTIIQYVKEDEQQPTDSIEDALAELVRQMEAQPAYVEYIAPTATVADVGTPVGNGTIIASAVNRFGKRIVHAYDETITVECTDDGTSGAEIFRFRGEPSQAKSSHLWPAGSGADVTLTAIGPTDRRNFVTNGSFETADDDDATLPDGWTKNNTSNTPVITPVEQQTVAIAGTPTGGFYILKFTDADGNAHQTDSLAYNASGTAVQAALRAIPTLEAVTVSASGTTPNFTHTVTFTGVRNPSALTYTSGLTGGTPSITVNTTVAGSANVYRGARAFSFTGDGATTGQLIATKLTGLAPNTVYAVALQIMQGGTTAAAGQIQAKLVSTAVGDGSGGVSDDEGTANTLGVSYTAIGTSYGWQTAFFRTPKAMPASVYLELYIAGQFTSGTVIYIDNLILAEATELYEGGPYVAAFSGNTDFAAGDKMTLTVVDSYAAEFQHWFHRFCDMETLELQLPSASGVASAQNEIQLAADSGASATGGTFTLTFGGETTGALAYNADGPTTVQSALQGLTSIGSGNATVTGTSIAGGYTVTFQGDLANTDVAAMTGDGSSLTGPDSPYTIDVATTQSGRSYLSDSVFIT